MRKHLRSTCITVLSKFRKIKPGVYILNGHFASPKKAVNKVMFREQLQKLSEKCILVNIQQALDFTFNPELMDRTKTYIAFTFDDGFEDCYLTLAPILEEFKVNAVFFINPNFVDGTKEYIENFTNITVKTPTKKPMNWKQIIDLDKRGFVIGNHTLDHARLSELGSNDIKTQVEESKFIIESKLNKPCEFFAWPYGQASDINNESLIIISSNHKYIFSGCNYKRYFSFDRKVINRRHFEASWPFSHLKYFLTFSRS